MLHSYYSKPWLRTNRILGERRWTNAALGNAQKFVETTGKLVQTMHMRSVCFTRSDVLERKKANDKEYKQKHS